ncbi:Hypothetical predicted protein [Mytilus galloprovincialis]|uniref:C2H2-type domain-containing protein n=1 Tax=Mytilus galloprovincialis TaxID=29158 RepID=A0A8B6GQX9_MYTGA|nr:Hypothetical predicted protein [Mytilus galloprovincialis]
MSTYECSPCNFTTRRTYQYQRHLQSTRHAQLHFLTSHESPVSQDHSPTQSISWPLIVQPPSSDNGSSNVSSPVQIDTHDQEYSEAISDDDLSDDVGDQATSKTEPQWFPFKSKAELLMYVLMNSTTHPVSDEIVKFIIFMMRELNVTDVPTLQSLKNKKIGDFSWKDFVTKVRALLRIMYHWIPIDMRQKQETIQFLGALEKADIMDVAKIIIDDIKSNRNGIETFDAANKKTCFVKGIVDCVVADFNMMSFCCNHLGATAQKYCPKCYADADHFMSLCQKRTPADTKLQLSRLNLRSLEKDKKKFRKKKGVKEHDNVMWDVLDPHRDIPVGLLHLLPLGLIKHLIQYIFNNIGENVKTKLMQHLLSIKPGAQFHDFDKHLGSRQGKDFKEYLQIAPINMLYAGVPRRYIKMATSLALKKLNETSFRSEDLDQIREDIREYQLLIYQYAPELTRKVKAHLLLHLVDDIERHGPPSGFLEDGFEKKHGNIRNLIFQQNQKARSRDTAFKFAQNFLCFHVITGGYFERSRIWTQASSKVLKCGEKGSILKFLGIAPEKSKIPGRVSLLKRDGNGHPIVERETQDALLRITLQMESIVENDNYTIERGTGVCAQNGDLIHAGDWVKYRNINSNICYGNFKEALKICPKRGSVKLIAVVLKCTITGDKVLQCPVLNLSNLKEYVPTLQILSKSPVIHNCHEARCKVIEGLNTEKIEQENIVRRTVTFKHKLQCQIYLLNVFKL